MSTDRFGQIVESFRKNVESVFRLAEFDHIVLDVAIKTLDGIQERATADGIDNYRLSVCNGLQLLKDIRTNDSLRPQYAHIFNQCVVLLVSYFSSAVSDIFETSLSVQLDHDPNKALLQEGLRLTVGELVDMDQGIKERLGELIIRKKDISFQDMQSIAKAFETYCNHSPKKDTDVNNIIAGQACRHVIVHTGAVASKRCVSQVSGATPRTLKQNLRKGEEVQFAIPELRILSESMIAYIEKLVSNDSGRVRNHPISSGCELA